MIARLRAAEEHLAICSAICERDEQAAALTTAAHIHNSLQAILTAFIEDVTGSTLMSAGPDVSGARDRDTGS